MIVYETLWTVECLLCDYEAEASTPGAAEELATAHISYLNMDGATNSHHTIRIRQAMDIYNE